MTIAQAVAKARRELKKLLAQAEESTAYMSKERFIIPKLRDFIDKHKNQKGNSNWSYHRESSCVTEELDKILTWDFDRLKR